MTDDVLAKVIVEGGPAIGKSPLMAANADLAGTLSGTYSKALLGGVLGLLFLETLLAWLFGHHST